MFNGYAFSIDYRDRRGHAYMLHDQEQTKRLTKPQSGSCLHCHASIMPLYRELGGGDAMKGFESTYKLSYQELSEKLYASGHGHPVGCVDCHDPKTMEIRVTRPGFIRGIQALAASDAPAARAAQYRAVARGRSQAALRSEPRRLTQRDALVRVRAVPRRILLLDQDAAHLPVGQRSPGRGDRKFWDETKFPDGEPFSDYSHAETGAHVLKAQHPEFELWNQGVHARAGVSCADCHMPYMREGASKVSDHWVRSPLLNVNRACQTCHRASEEEMKARVDLIQERNHQLLQRGGAAIVDLIDAIVAAQKDGAAPEKLERARKLQRQAQWRLDFVSSENSMGFHAPQEAARVLGEAIDFARQGQVIALGHAVTAAPAGSVGAAAGSVAPTAGSVAPPAGSAPPSR